MKQQIIAAARSMGAVLVAAIALTAFTACSNNDEPKIPEPQTFSGELTSTIPAMPNFEGVKCENSAEITWNDADQTSATVKIGAFKIEVNTPRGPMNYEIGSMTITDVACVKSGNKITMTKPEFNCMAGEFDTNGSFAGSLDGGKLSFVILYKPGSMPFDVQSEFVSK